METQSKKDNPSEIIIAKIPEGFDWQEFIERWNKAQYIDSEVPFVEIKYKVTNEDFELEKGRS